MTLKCLLSEISVLQFNYVIQFTHFYLCLLYKKGQEYGTDLRGGVVDVILYDKITLHLW